MIITLTSDKGAPGVTTLALVLAACWPGASAVAELDLRGADLAFRVRRADGSPLRHAPSIATLAVDARPGSLAPPIDRHAQMTSLGVSVVAGVVASPHPTLGTGGPGQPRAAQTLARHMPSIAAACEAWPGTVIADLGEVRSGGAALPVAKAAVVTLLVIRASVEGLSRVWERAAELAEILGDPTRATPPVGVVVIAAPAEAAVAERQVRSVLAAVGSPVPVVGVVAFDPKAVAAMSSNRIDRKLSRSALMRSGAALVSSILETWPEVCDRLDWRPPAALDHEGSVAQQASPATGRRVAGTRAGAGAWGGR